MEITIIGKGEISFKQWVREYYVMGICFVCEKLLSRVLFKNFKPLKLTGGLCTELSFLLSFGFKVLKLWIPFVGK